MGMVGCFYAVSDADLQMIIEKPQRVHALFGEPEPQKKPSLLGMLFGSKQTSGRTIPFRLSSNAEPFDVDKAWHGIHFLLTGTSWEGMFPLAFITKGGTEI